MIVVDPKVEPGLAALILFVRNFIESGQQGDFKVFVKDGEVRPVVEQRVTLDVLKKFGLVG